MEVFRQWARSPERMWVLCLQRHSKFDRNKALSNLTCLDLLWAGGGMSWPLGVLSNLRMVWFYSMCTCDFQQSKQKGKVKFFIFHINQCFVLIQGSRLHFPPWSVKSYLDKGFFFLNCCSMSLLCFTPGTAAFLLPEEMIPISMQCPKWSIINSEICGDQVSYSMSSYATTTLLQRAIRKKSL